MKIYSVHVDEIPESCGGCALMGYINDSYPV
nr:MAG TPA: RNHCP domain protein [Caudoviricetes sp.]